MSEADKQALRNNTATIQCKIIVIDEEDETNNIVLTESDAIKDWEYTDDRIVPGKGFIGQFVGRTLSGNLHNISDNFNISGREIELQLGIRRPAEESEIEDETDDNEIQYITTYYSLGNFFVTEPEDNEVNDNTKYEAMDYTKLFNAPFNADFTDEEFTVSYNDKMDPGNAEYGEVTALWLAQYTCKQVGVELATIDFTNNDFAIDINPFRAGETCRDVMKAVAQLAFSWARIDWDNRCYIDFAVPESALEEDVLDVDQYFELKTVEEVKPVDGVGFGITNIDGETAFLYAEGVTEETAQNVIYLYDNPLLYTFELRQAAVDNGGVLFGLTYMQLSTETIGHPWFTSNILIGVESLAGDTYYTLPLKNTIKYSGHIRSIISSDDKTEIEKTLGYSSSYVNEIRKAEIAVNKQEGTLTQLTESIKQLDERENNNYQDVLARFENYLSDADFTELQSIVRQIQTDTYTKTEVQQIASGVGADGVKVEAVITETGKFDIDGLLIEKENAKTKGRFNEVGMKITDATGSSDEELLFAGYDETLNESIVRSKNINVTKYLSIGTKTRIEDYEDGTGVFYVG